MQIRERIKKLLRWPWGKTATEEPVKELGRLKIEGFTPNFVVPKNSKFHTDLKSANEELARRMALRSNKFRNQ